MKTFLMISLYSNITINYLWLMNKSQVIDEIHVNFIKMRRRIYEQL